MASHQFQEDLDQLVVIRTSLDSAAAQLLKGVLESHGIPAFLANENMGTLNYVVATDLLVRTGDKARSELLLSNVSALNTQTDHVADNPFEEDLSCVHCSSSHTHPYVGALPTIFPGLNAEARPNDGWYHCLSCDSYWNDRPRRFRNIPIAVSWAATMGAITLVVIFLINWLKWL